MKVATSTRDRLARLASERGVTVKELVDQLAAQQPTRDELDARAAATADYIRRTMCPDLIEGPYPEAEDFLNAIRAGRIPHRLT